MKIGAIILAGGKSSRMGQDKGLLLINNKPMVTHVIDEIKKITSEVIIISNQKEYNQFEIPVFEDMIKNSGPLAGIYTGLFYSKYDKNLVLSCDVPCVTADLLNYLIKHSENYDVTIPTINNKTHQVIGVYSKSCMSYFKKELDSNQLKLKVALEKISLNLVDANDFDEQVFANVNTQEDIKQLQ